MRGLVGTSNEAAPTRALTRRGGGSSLTWGRLVGPYYWRRWKIAPGVVDRRGRGEGAGDGLRRAVSRCSMGTNGYRVPREGYSMG